MNCSSTSAKLNRISAQNYDTVKISVKLTTSILDLRTTMSVPSKVVVIGMLTVER